MNNIDKIYDEFNKIRPDIEISIEQMKSDLNDRFDKIVLYGAGSAGIAFLKYLNCIDIYPAFFADGKPEKWGEKCQGIEIISPEDIISRAGENTLVIVTINTDGKRYCKSFEEALRTGGHTGVHKRLRDAGCKNVVDYTYFRRCHALFHGDPYNLPSCSDIEIMLKNKDNVAMVYDWLEDDLSRETYEKIVKFRLVDDSIEVPTLSQENQYFEPGLYESDENACFVDCGAFNGISMQTFLKINSNRFEHYYGFEPDKFNFENLQKFIAGLPEDIKKRTEIFNCAAYDKCGTDMLYSLNGPGSFMADIGNESVETITIDNALRGRKATYIKMNIEGSELKALKGAEQTIKAFKPRLAIAGYHKTWDLWEVPMLIKSFRPDYKFNLRSYMNHLSFVYYCE
ncbi:FkbM family methyltransferase [Porcipelethomonas sp.]|uniref:FkbM family methyltransferase n=1 Tax=Porcipelethomonas sp. TaxID=2981675 RepID=UPI003EF761FE